MNEQALKARLKHIGKAKGKSFNEVWKLLVLERFLARLSRSKYTDKFIFKGGLLLSYYLTIGRETIDIDLLARGLNAEKSNVELIMQEICLLKLDDGFRMQFINLDDLDHQHMNYPGFQIGIAIQFGVMSDKFFVDIGVGDVVEPVLLDWPSFSYKEIPLFNDSISLEVYPVETIFAEKLETLISRGSANSRMKDYHDLLLLCRSESKLIDKIRLKDNITQTFQNRGTVFSLPVQFQSDELERIQLLWSGHLRVLGVDRVQAIGLPEKIDTVIHDLNQWLLTIWSG
ncbi:TPA: nucleotidyl transferase AbiEii/AbiGii toxin family protein [Legionella pneumophila]|nr:nucleotidyl transferase AbiEii/AbiGii toxin family protein [Legionella pneumophila]